MRVFEKLILVVLGFVLVLPVAAQGLDSASARTAQIDALKDVLAIERQLLDSELERFDSLTRRRPETMARLGQFYTSVEAEVGRREDAVPDRLDQLVDLAVRAESELDLQLADERDSLRRVREHLRRIAALEEKVEGLAGERDEETTGILTGNWDLVLMPLEQRGGCVLTQTGAVVNGTYRLEGGYTGSLQGTLVNRKVYLVRIDSRMGKMMEFEGYLSGDGKQIRGTWLNYELAGSEGSTGQWSAKRRPAEP